MPFSKNQLFSLCEFIGTIPRFITGKNRIFWIIHCNRIYYEHYFKRGPSTKEIQIICVCTYIPILKDMIQKKNMHSAKDAEVCKMK